MNFPKEQFEIYKLAHPYNCDPHWHIVLSSVPNIEEDLVTVSVSSRVDTTRSNYIMQRKYPEGTLPILNNTLITDIRLKNFLSKNLSYANCNSLYFFDSREFNEKYICGPFCCPTNWIESLTKAITISYENNRISKDVYSLIFPEVKDSHSQTLAGKTLTGNNLVF